MNLDQIDTLLKQPLAPVADNGFSARVIARVRKEEQRRTAAVALASVLAATLLCLLVPLNAFLGDLSAALFLAANSPTVGLAGALLVLTFLIDRLYTDRKFLTP